MIPGKKETLSGWGNLPNASCRVYYPRAQEEVFLNGIPGPLIPRGLGRSYADQATNEAHAVVKLEKLNRFLHFDESTGILTAEAGVSFFEIIRHLTPRGWFPLITPGTKYITLGGAIANDIHGKSHHVDGSFVNCVRSFTILLANGEIAHASRDENAELFWANFGGLGLLGTILTVTLQLRKIETTYFRQEAAAIRDLHEMMDKLEASETEYSSSVAWIDPLARGKRIGRGVLTMGNHALREELPAKLKDHPLRLGRPAKVKIPFFLPSFLLNSTTIGILNTLIYAKQKSAAQFTHYDPFFYPLDVINDWNKGYGRRGFIQYQFVVPLDDARKNIRSLMAEIAGSACIPFLNVLKKFGPGNQAPLSFPMAGYTLAIDFPVTSQLLGFTRKLDKMVYEMGGRIYLGKDAYLTAPMFRAMYPRAEEWLQVKRRYDPTGRYASDLSRRLEITS